jgi:aspartyl-tRNA(Asn)/glutamyl-tRNA(Gln) amidotransferase subunit A
LEIAKKHCDLTIAEASSAMAKRELTPSQLLNSCLERINALEGKIKAWTLIDQEGTLATAKRLDQELSRGQPRGPLHGIPIGVKDIIYTAGLRTEAGSKSWAGFVPDYDATVVTRLKEAGAIILGKTHTTEFAYFDPAPTCNPWNTRHTPGGSSSGSAAALAAGMCLASLGSQTLGSVLRPGAFNGIVGFKPNYGRISAYGVVPVSWNLDHMGIFTRTVEDNALVFQAIAGYDPKYRYSLNEPVPDCLSRLENKKTPRIGLVKQYFFDHADEEMRRHTEEVVAHLQRVGANIREIKSPADFAAIYETGRLIMTVEAAAYHQESFAQRKDQYRPAITKLVKGGFKIPATKYSRALQARLEYRIEIEPLFHQVEALLTPGAVGAAPKGLISTGNPVMQAPWTVMGLPAISLPTGLNQEGLPLAIQLVGPPKGEDHLLAVAQWCEKTLNVSLRPPLD